MKPVIRVLEHAEMKPVIRETRLVSMLKRFLSEPRIVGARGRTT